MSKIALLGDETAGLAFMGLGVVVHGARGPEALDVWAKIKDEYSLILVTESIYQEIKESIDEITGIAPAVLVIPDAGPSTGVGFQRMKSLVEKAVGVDIISKKFQH